MSAPTEMLQLIKQLVAGKSVLVTGHTGFKGSWLSAWLASMGARVTGIALAPDQGEDNIFERARIKEQCTASHLQDICEAPRVAEIFAAARPQIVFHLAAQPLVRRAYREPLVTFATNVMGTANVLEAARATPSVSAVVCVTTDKVYANNEWCWPYRESDALGGIDPYSASKAAAEMVARAYMTTLLPTDRPYQMATARGGNVIGGGDWAEDRIVPDIVRSIRADRPLVIRNPGATRPWQHVLELCFGYLILAMRLSEGRAETSATPAAFSGAWNFGPDANHEIRVSSLIERVLHAWGRPDFPIESQGSNLHESRFLRLDSSKARTELGWRPVLQPDETFDWTASWYRSFLGNEATAAELIGAQITAYEDLISRRVN